MTRDWAGAVSRASVEALQGLSDRGADTDTRNGHGQTALMLVLAAGAGRGRLVEWLIERGAGLESHGEVRVKRSDAIWRRLLDRAGPRPGLPLTDDPDLHLPADGARISCPENGNGRLDASTTE